MTSLLPPQTSPMDPKEQPTGAEGAAATEATTVTIMPTTTTATVDAGTATTLVDVVITTTTATETQAATAITGTAIRTTGEAAAVEADTPTTTATEALATATTSVAGVVTVAAEAEADTVTTDAEAAAAERITATTTEVTARAAAEALATAAAATTTTVAAAAIAVTPRIATTTAAAVAVTPITRRATAHALTATPTIITAPTRIPQASSAAAVVPFRRSASMRLRGTKGAGNAAAAAAAAAAGVSHSTRAHLDGSTTNGSSKPLFGETIAKFAHYRSWSNLGQRQTSKAEEEANATATATPSQFNETRFHALCLALTEQPTELQFLDNMEAKSRNMSLKLNGGSAETASNASVTSTSTPKTPQTPLNGGVPSNHIHCSRSAKTLNRKQDTLPASASASASASIGKLSTVHETKISPKTPPVTPDSPSTYLDDDLDSMYSFATTTSGRSTMSCEHPYVARNGTTFSGRKMKYVVHCSNYAGQVGADYLTPTQRAQRQIRRLKELLSIARQDLEVKDTEILRLTREVVELRLFKASLSSPEERSASSDAVTVREAELKTSQDVSPIVDMVDEAKCSPRHLARQHQQLQAMQMSAEMQSSYADSGHFEDLTMSSVHSKDSQTQSDTPDETAAEAEAEAEAAANHLENYELQRQELIRMYEHRIEELIRTQDGATSDLKRSHNDKVEALLQKLAECNTRYSDIVPDYEHAKQRIRELEKQLEDLQRKLIEHEEKQNKMYLHMYQQGQEAERISRADQAMELAQRQPDSKVSINELLHQLQSTQDELENIRTIYRRLLEAQKNRTHVDPEVTLQFLKSAIFYFLTDKENSQGHLQAIESILEFTEEEKSKINQARSPK